MPKIISIVKNGKRIDLTEDLVKAILKELQDSTEGRPNPQDTPGAKKLQQGARNQQAVEEGKQKKRNSEAFSTVEKGGPGSGRKTEGGSDAQALDPHANDQRRLRNTIARAKSRGLATGYHRESKSDKPFYHPKANSRDPYREPGSDL